MFNLFQSKKPIKVELEFNFHLRNEDFVEYYQKEAEKTELELEREKYLARAKELLEEREPTNQEIYDFLSSNNYDDENQPPRYISLANTILDSPVYDISLFIKKDKVFLSFMMKPNDKFDSINSVKNYMNDYSFVDTYYEGSIGNELRFPSRKDSTDLLGELSFNC
jgi:hypothetical protein